MAQDPLEAYDPEQVPSTPIVEAQHQIPSAYLDPRPNEDLEAWEHRLDRLEDELVRRGGGVRVPLADEPDKNWPRFYPLVYCDPNLLTANLRGIVEFGLTAWIMLAVAFAINFVGCLILLGAGDAVTSPGSKIAMAALWLFIGAPFALDLNAAGIFRMYLASSDPSFVSYVKQLAVTGFTTLLAAWLAIGFEDSGSCGAMVTLELLFEGHIFIGLFGLVCTAAMLGAGLLQLRLLNKLRNAWGQRDEITARTAGLFSRVWRVIQTAAAPNPPSTEEPATI